MRVGIPKEVKNHEYRVGMIPAGVHSLVEAGHEVVVQSGAGDGSGIEDSEYETAGARLVDVRECDEFSRGHLPGAVNVPVGEIVQRAEELRGGDSILYCQSGLRSQRALQLLKKKRLDRVYNLGALGRWS